MNINPSIKRTCNNYLINDLKIQDFSINEKPVCQSEIDFPSCLFKESASVKLSKPISEELEKMSENFSNANYSIFFDRTEEKFAKINLSSNEGVIENVSIAVKENVTAKAVVCVKSALHLGRIKLSLGENSNFSVIVLLEEGQKSFLTIESESDENAICNIFIADFSNGLSAQNVYIKNIGNNSKTNLDSIYLGNGLFDLNYLCDIVGQRGECEINTVGALLGGEKNFKGTINFVSGAKKSVGREKEYCLLLSDNAKSKALPMLLCGEEDVDGTHSSSCGQIDEKTLFYLLSRGLDAKEAKKLITKASLEEECNKIFSDEIKEKIEEIIDRKFEYVEF